MKKLGRPPEFSEHSIASPEFIQQIAGEATERLTSDLRLKRLYHDPDFKTALQDTAKALAQLSKQFQKLEKTWKGRNDVFAMVALATTLVNESSSPLLYFLKIDEASLAKNYENNSVPAPDVEYARQAADFRKIADECRRILEYAAPKDKNGNTRRGTTEGRALGWLVKAIDMEWQRLEGKRMTASRPNVMGSGSYSPSVTFLSNTLGGVKSEIKGLHDFGNLGDPSDLIPVTPDSAYSLIITHINGN